MEDNLNGRQPQLKMTFMEDDLKNLKLDFPINHWVDLDQVLNLSSVEGIN